MRFDRLQPSVGLVSFVPTSNFQLPPRECCGRGKHLSDLEDSVCHRCSAIVLQSLDAAIGLRQLLHHLNLRPERLNSTKSQQLGIDFHILQIAAFFII
ncbi:hypothetical protein HBI56_191170 [Parastagonospora nodorum]|uniref:Uncharacterized protein n=2 Tax=Phaeosphaeria nodorum (strain SN15 / ATCC MYA-4574 / FGSC 10173) TaxID=321614 RepID=A0A7U2IAN6_PHANO|nr:hypothetical protein SNOG_14777 [Parastagonospora nodorum SN15]KAH3908218.1 hypothetical protein HBH56_179280 [Parastagonospora nodorum]EAT77969.1 hypothetical protein SNOG_14777 [Parastagonospora nodorum SN15]KAH3932150.1 hypothetical protein HBH54_090550 [Parastagonospora nodorum]KAH3996266.1 hypothetical protein HBI10_160830 [Parastagonospora nodorum]KAH4019471.1 hypothetical protein HBI13_125190 [Parastagonospora nodorum]